MAKPNDDFVDISSSADVNKVYGDNYARERQVPQRNYRRKNQGLGIRITVLVLSLLFLLAGAGVVFGYDFFFGKHQYDPLTDQKNNSANITANQNTSETTYVSVAGNKDSLLSSNNVLNVLLFGQDSRGDGEDYGRSDTTILMSIDNVHKKIKLTSFQRDTYVTIPGYGNNKINSAYTFGGERLSIDTIESNFGIKVDKYATVDFTAFREVIDVLGGVDIEMNLEEIKYVNAQIDVNDQLDVTEFLTYDETKETQVMHLDGYQALWYARDRGEDCLGGNPEYSFSGDDWDRTSRQRKLIQTIITSLRSEASLSDLVSLVNKVGPLIRTNLKNSDITFLVSNMMTYIDYDIEQMSLPTLGTWRYGTTEDGQSVIVIDDMDAAHRAIAEFIYEDSVSVKSNSTTAQPPSETVVDTIQN